MTTDLGTCVGPECTKTAHRRNGLCKAHDRQRLEGKPLKPLAVRRSTAATVERDAQGRKLCPSCSDWLELANFAPAARQTDGLASWCRACTKLSNYGMNARQFRDRLTKQGGRCATCPTEHTDEEPLCVDHDHGCCPGQRKSCGRCVRGLLCRRCNTALGMVNDDVDRLLSLVRYLSS